jgi:hypothetical protein
LPASILPLLKVVPSLEVTVCAYPSLFVHVTTVPLATVLEAGEKVILIMLIPDPELPPPAGGFE